MQESGSGSAVRLGRAVIDGRATALIQLDEAVYRLTDLAPDLPGVGEGSLDRLFAAWAEAGPAVAALAAGQARPVAVATDAFLAPVERPQSLICIGINYTDHIAEMGIPTNPAFPYAFLKPLTTIARPIGPVTLPAASAMVDWEAELGVVIGRAGRDIASENALDHVAGYLPLNDVSARDWVEDRPALGIDWVMQKAHDGFTPLGPWITLAAAVPDPQGIPVQCRLNGELMQDSSTRYMLFSVAEIIAHLSRFMTLAPGDVIATGTPAGVGFGMKPRRFISDGDVVTVSLGLLGSFDTRFVAGPIADRAKAEQAAA